MNWAATMDAPDGTMCLIGCGSRHWSDPAVVAVVLERVRMSHPLLTVIEGGAPGADLCVARWAASMRPRGVAWVHEPARWDEHAPWEKWQAAHARNQVMVDRLVAARARNHGVAVVAFKGTLDVRLFGDRPADARGGTEDCVRRAWACDVPVWWSRGGSPARCLPAPTLPGVA